MEIPLGYFPFAATTAQDPIQAMQAQINELKKLEISAGKQPVHVPPTLTRKEDHETRSLDAEADDEQIDKEVQAREKALTSRHSQGASRFFRPLPLVIKSSTCQNSMANLTVNPMETLSWIADTG